MYRLSEIKLLQFRNFSQAAFAFPSAVIGITGANGIGKTNLLDAVYYLCYTKSYFQNKEINNVLYGEQGFRVTGEWQALEGETAIRTSCVWREGRKTVSENEVDYEKTTDHIGKYTAVMIAPDDIEVINDGSELRRKFMDGLLAQSKEGYLQHLLDYQKVLAQRNASLKMPRVNHDLLDVYDSRLAYHGAALIAGRQQLTEAFPELVQAAYTGLSNGMEKTHIHYRQSAQADQLNLLLRQSRERDMELRRTLHGPHTEDWLFTIDDKPVKTHASQGQKKSFLIGLKLAQMQWLQQLGKNPLLLLDDIFEKLDKQRLSRFFELLQRLAPLQILMTHTDGEDLQKAAGVYFPEIEIIRL